MASVVGEDEKRHAFTVKLGVHLPAGRQSQIDSVQNVKVRVIWYNVRSGGRLYIKSACGGERGMLR